MLARESLEPQHTRINVSGRKIKLVLEQLLQWKKYITVQLQTWKRLDSILHMYSITKECTPIYIYIYIYPIPKETREKKGDAILLCEIISYIYFDC